VDDLQKKYGAEVVKNKDLIAQNTQKGRELAKVKQEMDNMKILHDHLSQSIKTLEDEKNRLANKV